VRLINRVLAALLILALACAGGLLIIEVGADRLQHRAAILNWRPAYTWAARTDWAAGSIRVTEVVLILLGLLLLLAEVKPPRVSRLAADPAGAGAPGMDTAYTRRGVAAAVRSAVTDVDGIRSASVKVNRRRLAVTAVAAALDKTAAQAVRDAVITAAHDRLTALHLRRAPALSVRVTPRSR
jgi:Family of unknown function (DUF6286)